MKLSRHNLTIIVLVILSILIIFWKSPQKARRAAAELPKKTTMTTKDSSTVVVQSVPAAAIAEESPEAVVPPEDTTIATIVNTVDLMKSDEISKAVAELQRLPAEQVSVFFLDSLRTLGPDHGYERDRIVMIANSMQLKTDLPLWEDLVRRQTPRYTDEDKIRNPKHPTLESRFVDMEQMQAIRNIGLLARDNRQARRVLVDIILNPSAGIHRALHREEAYTILKETDLTASLRVLKQLPVDDELLKRL